MKFGESLRMHLSYVAQPPNACSIATKLFLFLPCVSAVRDRLQEANIWILEVKERCQPREVLAVEASAGQTGRDSLPLPRSSVPSVRKKGKEKEKEKEKTDEKSRFKGGERNSVSPPLPTLSVSQALLALLQAGKALKIDVKKEVALLEHTLAAIERWDTQTSSALLSLDSLHLAPLVSEYRRFLQRISPTDIKAEAEAECEDVVRMTDGSCSSSSNDAGSKSGWSRFPCTEGLCGPQLSTSAPAHALAIESSSISAECDTEGTLWESQLRFYAEMQLLSDQAAELGIWTGSSDGTPAGSVYSSFLQLELCQASIRWIDEARALMCFPLDLNHPLQAAPAGLTHSASCYKVKETNNRDEAKDVEVVVVSSRSDSTPISDALSTSERKKTSRKQKGEAPGIASADSCITADTLEPCAEPGPAPPSWGDCSRYACPYI